MLITFIPLKDSKGIIRLNPKTAKSIGLFQKHKIFMRFGMRIEETWIEVSNRVKVNTIEISQKVNSNLLIDTNLKYEVKLNDDYLIIGPVIGLLLEKKDSRLVDKLQKYEVYMNSYPMINGLVSVFSEDQIDFANDQITGYVYQPNDENHWQKKILPFPTAIYRRIEMPKDTFDKLVRKMGNRLFNSYYFNKWDFWNYMQDFPEIKIHLPETTNVISNENLQQYLNQYQGVYLKPINGTRGRGIFYLTKEKNTYTISKNYDEEIIHLEEKELNSFLIKQKNYLLQQPILLKEYQGRKVDYRLMVQKNQDGNWECTGVIGRFGKVNGITTNFRKYGFAKDGFEAIKLQFHLDNIAAYKKYDLMVENAIKTAKAIDFCCGPYADLGIDMAFDKDGKVWIIEINKRYDHDLPLDIKDEKMFYTVKSKPLLFAKMLAMK